MRRASWPCATRAASPRARPQRSRVPRILGAVLVGVGLTTILAVGLAVAMVTTTVGVLSVGLPDPSQLEALTFSEPTVVYDRTGKVELGRFQREERRVVAFGDVPELVLDATTSAEDRTFWSNSGFDAPAILSAAAEGASGARERGASTITQQLVRARLLPVRRDRGRRRPLHAQGQGADPVAAGLRDVPRRAGQGPDHHGLPQRDLLRPRRVRRRGRGVDLLRRLRPRQADPGPGGAAGRAAQVALDPRPVPLRRQGRQGPARRAARRSAGRPARLDPRRARRAVRAGRS